MRREIRDMSREELVRFQRAVGQLQASEDRVWDQFRDLYMYHVMHASAGEYFLPWHRAFLRQMEQKLQVYLEFLFVLVWFTFSIIIQKES